MISGKTIAKNVGVMMASQLVTWGLAFVLAIFLPRYLGVTAIGAISIANSIWMIMSVLFAFGMDTHLTKSISRDPSSTSELLSTSLLLRVVFFAASCGVVALYTWVMGYDAQLLIVVSLMGAAFLFASFSGALNAALIGLERMEFVSISNIVSKGLLTGLSVLLIVLDAGLYPIVAVSIIAALSSSIILFLSVRRSHPLRFRVDMTAARAMLFSSSAYLVSGLAMTVYQQIDKLFIQALVDTRTVGWYGTAMNLFGTTMFLPVVFGTVIFPSLARSYATGDAKLNLIAQRSFDLMFMLSVPVGFGIVVVGQPLVDFLYGPEFAQSGPILMMLGIVLIFTYLNTILGQLLISTDRTGKWNLVMIAAILLTLPLDLWLVPWTNTTFGNGALGGTLAFLVTEFGMVVAAILLMPRHTLQWSNVRTAVLTLLAGLLMMATSWWFRESLMIVSILVGAATYVAAVMLLRIVPREDLALIRKAIMGVVGRLRRSKEAPASIGN